MTFCVYDNPKCMHREAYGDGKLIGSMSWIIVDKAIKEGLPEKIPFVFNIGTFTPGEVYGDVEALPPEFIEDNRK